MMGNKLHHAIVTFSYTQKYLTFYVTQGYYNIDEAWREYKQLEDFVTFTKLERVSKDKVELTVRCDREIIKGEDFKPKEIPSYFTKVGEAMEKLRKDIVELVEVSQERTIKTLLKIMNRGK